LKRIALAFGNVGPFAVMIAMAAARHGLSTRFADVIEQQQIDLRDPRRPQRPPAITIFGESCAGRWRQHGSPSDL
jgi:hypothetical protein